MTDLRSGRPTPPALSDFQRSLEIAAIYRKGSAPVGAALPRRIRVLSWNIEHGSDPERIAAALREFAPDIACLQEVDWANERTGGRDVLQELAAATGMLGLFAVEFLELPSRRRPAKFAGGGATGNALLTRFEPNASFRIELPAPFAWQHAGDNPELPDRLRRRVRREPHIGSRVAICAEFALPTGMLSISCLHLEDKFGGIAARWSQYRAAVDAIAARQGCSDVAVIGGDFNTFDCRLARIVSGDRDATALGKPGSLDEAQWWCASLLPPTGYRDPFTPQDWTFAVGPLFHAKLDWITVKGVDVSARGIGPLYLSDHRPIWVDLLLPA